VPRVRAGPDDPGVAWRPGLAGLLPQAEQRLLPRQIEGDGAGDLAAVGVGAAEVRVDAGDDQALRRDPGDITPAVTGSSLSCWPSAKVRMK
jgi:hypothetical protein